MPKFTIRKFNEIAGSILALRGSFVDIYNARKLRALIDKATTELTGIEKDFNSLVERYGAERADGKYEVKKEHAKAFNTEWGKYQDDGEVVLPNVKIPEKALEYACISHIDPVTGKEKPPTLTVGNITDLYFIFTEEEKEEKAAKPDIAVVTEMPTRKAHRG